jgi:hypothetical protein
VQVIKVKSESVLSSGFGLLMHFGACSNILLTSLGFNLETDDSLEHSTVATREIVIINCCVDRIGVEN